MAGGAAGFPAIQTELIRMKPRTKLRLFLAAVAAVVGLGTFGSVAPASAVCGGGAPGEPCYCPGGIKVLKWTIGEVQC